MNEKFVENEAEVDLDGMTVEADTVVSDFKGDCDAIREEAIAEEVGAALELAAGQGLPSSRMAMYSTMLSSGSS